MRTRKHLATTRTGNPRDNQEASQCRIGGYGGSGQRDGVGMLDHPQPAVLLVVVEASAEAGSECCPHAPYLSRYGDLGPHGLADRHLMLQKPGDELVESGFLLPDVPAVHKSRSVRGWQQRSKPTPLGCFIDHAAEDIGAVADQAVARRR
ncbi:hypothetical protein ACFYWN_35315 [Streptomyces sp. NPDC002917]|uniref:hypothetical protein n=2 Tax=unclassified Streptomyces TaxID=2593676 RepID=UPI00369403CE